MHALKANVQTDIESCDAGIILFKKKGRMICALQKWPINDQEQKNFTGGKSYMCD